MKSGVIWIIAIDYGIFLQLPPIFFNTIMG